MMESQQLKAVHPKQKADIERLRGQNERLTLFATPEGGDLVEAQLYATNVQQVAKMFESMSKQPGYLFARYGGEEFAAIVPETGEMEAIDRRTANLPSRICR